MCVCINESQKDALFIFHVDLHMAWAFLNIATKFTGLAILKRFDLSNIRSHEMLSFIKDTERDGGNILPDCIQAVLGRQFQLQFQFQHKDYIVILCATEALNRLYFN
jgi:hypothetical protein